MEFKVGDIISHVKSFSKFYVIVNDYKNGQYEVEDCEPNEFGNKERKVLMGKYFLTKADRRNYLIDDIFDNKLLD
jgi:hypothetical protein